MGLRCWRLGYWKGLGKNEQLDGKKQHLHDSVEKNRKMRKTQVGTRVTYTELKLWLIEWLSSDKKTLQQC